MKIRRTGRACGSDLLRTRAKKSGRRNNNRTAWDHSIADYQGKRCAELLTYGAQWAKSLALMFFAV
jgi:hypothetical protein